MNNFTIIVPCYNEAGRLSVTSFLSFLEKQREVSVLFVNDASTDNTYTVLNKLKEQLPNQIAILENSKNKGKAESNKNGISHLRNNQKK